MIQYNRPSISFNEKDIIEIRNIIESGWVSIDKHVARVEEHFRSKCNVKHAIGCASATSGLTIALKSVGWRKKRIAVPSFTWPSTIYAIESNVGNTPVFCDIDRHSLNIDIKSLPPDSYDAIVAVDIFGNACNVQTDKPIIYDAAHGYDLNVLGKRGIVEVISFSFTKVVTAMEGGMILTNNDEVAEVATELRRLSSRMSEINAVILNRSISEFRHNQEMKVRHIDTYKKLLSFDYALQEITSETNRSVFAIIVREKAVRDSIARAFEQNNIGYKTYYQPLVEGLPNTDWVYDHILCLPLYPALASEEVEYICKIANNAASHIHVGHNYLRNSTYLDNYIRKQI